MKLKNVTVEWKGLLCGIKGNVLTIPFLNFQQKLANTNVPPAENTLEKELFDFVKTLMPSEQYPDGIEIRSSESTATIDIDLTEWIETADETDPIFTEIYNFIKGRLFEGDCVAVDETGKAVFKEYTPGDNNYYIGFEGDIDFDGNAENALILKKVYLFDGTDNPPMEYIVVGLS